MFWSEQDNTLIIICHYSVCVIYDLSEEGRSTQLLIPEHQSANYQLCFLPEERLFSSIIDLDKNILAAFITRLIRHPEETKPNGKTTMYCSPDSGKFVETPCIFDNASNVEGLIITHYRCKIISNGILFCIPRKLYFHFLSKCQL